MPVMSNAEFARLAGDKSIIDMMQEALSRAPLDRESFLGGIFKPAAQVEAERAAAHDATARHQRHRQHCIPPPLHGARWQYSGVIEGEFTVIEDRQ